MRKSKKPDDTLPLSIFVPESNWMPPKQFPNLGGVRTLAIDIETRDPRLEQLGPGFIRGDAEVVGISCATNDAGWYFPFSHHGGGNMEREPVIRFFQDLLKDRDRWIVGANLQYELEGLDSLEIQVQGRLVDVQVAEPLLDEESAQGYALEVLCQKYLGRGKDERLLREAASAYGVDPKSGLWKLHSRYVGPYAIFDAQACLQILPKQLERLKEEELLPIFEMESKITRLLWLMRKQGIPVDVDAAKKFRNELEDEENKLREDFNRKYGCRLDEWSGPLLASLCDQQGIRYPRTPKGNPSFTGDYLDGCDHPMLKTVAEIRVINRLKGTFIDDWILKHVINGRVHPQWRQLASDEGGTRSGRMAAANPNPQQVPARSDLAPKLRKLFRYDDWAKLDYSQQEPRLMVHYAHLCKCTGADKIRDAYIQNPNLDYYDFLKESCGMPRRDSKDCTLGRMYNMGVAKFAAKLNIPESESREKLEAFDRNAPYVRELNDLCMNSAQTRGYIKTILGRRRHFNLYEPRFQSGEERPIALPLHLAQQAWPGQALQRAYSYKALNALIQGSAADMTKAAALKCWEEDGAIPFMLVHDEGDYPSASEAESQHLKHQWENCVTTTVPMKVDLTHGKHWK